MTKRFCALIIVVSAFTATVSAAPLFRTLSLERLCKAMQLHLPDSLGINVHNDSTWNFQGKPLRIRTNAFGDVSHVGYKLFDSSLTENYDPQILLDFIERYALEQDVRIEGQDLAEEAARKNIAFAAGNAKLLSLHTPDMGISIQETERRGFVVEWGTGKKRIKMAIPADYQVLCGTNAIELENLLERNLLKTPVQILPADSLPSRWQQATISEAGNYIIASNGKFLSDQIRSDLFLKKSGKGAKIIIDPAKPQQSANNILLTGCTEKPIALDLTLNKYGHKKSVIHTTLQQFLRFCELEGCQPYLGFKSKDGETIKTTLFAVNQKMAYNHTLSLEFPLSILRDGSGTVRGELYAYTPLQNITEDFFNQDISNKENER